jgi:hypothetical protein
MRTLKSRKSKWIVLKILEVEPGLDPTFNPNPVQFNCAVIVFKMVFKPVLEPE